MTNMVISDKTKSVLERFLEENSSAELVNTYLCFIENKLNIQPVLFPPGKMIFQSKDHALTALEKEGKVWHEAEIKIDFGQRSVNEETKRIYICPFTGKVFGDNTHPNPQDAIYDWVSKCPENTERSGGLRVKRFFISEDPEVIKQYMGKEKKKEPITKVVYSSVMSGKLFNSKEAVVKEFCANYLKPMSLVEVQSQNRFSIDEKFLEFIQEQLTEERIASFVEALAEYKQFTPYIEKWLG